MNTLNRRQLLQCLAVLTSTLSLPACADPLVEMSLLDRATAQPLRSWWHAGNNWVEGQPGARYSVRLQNRSGGRVLVVLSVDGVNAISGETAHPGQTGYVLDPWATAEITGWRKDMNEAANFYFSALPDSYAARTGRPDNVGVIGAAVFREAQPMPDPVTMAPAAAAPASKAGAPAMRESEQAMDKKADRLGTGHGEREYSPTTYTGFERASRQPAQVVQLRYESRARLVALGVIPSRRPSPPPAPQPFPGFVPDPQG